MSIALSEHNRGNYYFYKGADMAKIIEKPDLCINCLNACECGYRATHQKPIIFCEEFSCNDSENFESQPFKRNGTETLRTDMDKIADTDHHPVSPDSEGICCNCANNGTCRLKNTEEPVMNCEEYK